MPKAAHAPGVRSEKPPQEQHHAGRGLVDSIASAVDDVKGRLGDEAAELRGAVQRLKTEKLQALHELEEAKKAAVAHALFDKVNAIFDYIFEDLGDFVKAKLTDDEYMPRAVKRFVRTMVNAVWPDIRMEAKHSCIEAVTVEDPLEHGAPNCRCSPLALVRYTLFPYDRNIWRHIRDPLWWLLTIVSVVPVYAISQLWYMLMLFIIDKNDEFQLQLYITNFKALQWVALGVLSCVVGALQYYMCTTAAPSTCHRDGPREGVFTVGVFVVQIFFLWAALYLSRKAQKKGGQYYQMTAAARAVKRGRRKDKAGSLLAVCTGQALQEAAYEANRKQEKVSRRRLLRLLIYDLVIFILCLVLTAFAAFYNTLDDRSHVTYHDGGAGDANWKFGATLFWIKAFYGLMSFPFVLLKVPALNTLFSHAKPTGYNRYGNTVPFRGVEELCATPWKEATPPKQEGGDTDSDVEPGDPAYTDIRV
jgi:hypothetical protein